MPGGGVTPAPRAEGSVPSASTKQRCMGTGANRDRWARAPGQGPTLGRVPCTHGCPTLVMMDGNPPLWPGSQGWLQAGSQHQEPSPGAITARHPQLCLAFPADAPFRSPAAAMEPSAGLAESRPAWKALGRQLPSEPQGTSSDQPQRSFVLAEPSGLPEPGGREGWSSSLPRLGRSMPAALPRRVSHGGELGAGSPQPTLSTPPDTEGRDARTADGVPRPTAGVFLEPLGNGGQQGPKQPALGADGGLPEGRGAAGRPPSGNSPLLFQTTS